ncbi:Acyltransferase [Aphelenchoides fujianensis]|nr:Acyltransferase [Aphelenchoides fujianensis]
MQLLHNIPLLKSANAPHSSASGARIADIQGLRGISIVAVFVYHLHTPTLPMGFLGVDVFFGISGFLMATILSKQQPLDWTKFRAFYFRRVKRIVPVYLFVILLVLGTAGGFFLNPTDFHALFHEAAKPLLFVANIPASRRHRLLRRIGLQHTNHYPFFKHCWSLCAEIQWYILAPLFFSILELYSRSARLLILSLISALSFAVQWNSSGNFEHMALVNRLWQFLLGIVAFEQQQAREDGNKEEQAGGWRHWAQRSFDFFLPLFLVLLLASPLSPHRQLHRLLQPALTELGNVSYSIYMVHWPLIQAYTYTWPVFGVIDVVGMFVAGVLLGFLLEKSYNRLAVHITSWFSLLSVLFVLYVLILDSLLFLRLHTPDQRLFSDEKFALEDPAQVEADAIAMWRGTFDRRLTPLDSALYSRQFHRLNWDSSTCPNTKKSAIPTTFDLRKIGLSTMDDIEGISASCVVEVGGDDNEKCRYIFFV